MSALALEISLPVTICESWVGISNRYQTVPGACASGQNEVQLTAAVPCGTGSHTVPGGLTFR